ncbi:MAG TPA: sigma-70 family RNA polymerase sigma factor [Bordetella sp.]
MAPNSSAGAVVHSLYAAHHSWLFGWLRHKLGCEQQAAELANDTFVRLLASRQAEQLREPRAYLTRVAHGLVVNHWRRLTLERTYLDALAAQPEAVSPSPEQRMLALEALCRLDAMLDSLGAKVREAFLLSQLDGLTYAQIAERLQVSERMVKKYMTQAMLQCLLVVGGAPP